MIAFTINSVFIAKYHEDFGLLGKKITFKIPELNHKVSIHYYCSHFQNSPYPTIILQNGGGGNLAGFMPLLNKLEEKGIKMCIYDRLGYGRSSKFIPKITPKQKAQMTDFMFQKLLRTDEHIIYGGWSAGVQIAMTYQYYFPQKIRGLIFIDGYPDYLLLQAINTNSSTKRNPHTILIASLFRVLQPFGIDFFFGKSPIENATLNQYNKAYYRNGYLWDTQTTELQGVDSTEWLSSLAKEQGDFLPYPDAKVYLNWPNTEVPLLVMPSNDTIQGAQYRIQSQKYIEKCTNQIKMYEIMKGDHGFVYEADNRLVQVILEFIHKINQQ